MASVMAIWAKPGILSRLAHRTRLLSAPHYYQASSDSAVSKTEDSAESKDVPEEEFVLSKFDNKQILPARPIISLDLERNIDKVEKRGSFSVDLFIGKFDSDFLTYPEPLGNRLENQKLKEQAAMVQQLWPQIYQDELQQQTFHFNCLYQLSVTEMATIFEACGAAAWNCFEHNLPTLQGALDPRRMAVGNVSKSIISLIIRNCLTYRPIHRSESQAPKELLPKKNILLQYSDSSITSDHQPIGFCWTERGPQLGSLPPQEWQTLGTSGGPATEHYHIQGAKHKILHEPDVEHFLVFYKDKLLSQSYMDSTPNDQPNAAADPFTGCILLKRSELQVSKEYSDWAGIKYFDANIDALVPNDRSVLAAERLDPRVVNIKALGQLAISSAALGLLKDSLRRTYKHLLDNRRGIIDCDIIDAKLTQVTCKIYAIESVLYFVAGMFDGLKEGFDASLESAILKIITYEYGTYVLQELQQVCGSQLPIMTQQQDFLNVFDGFLDGSVHNRMYLATMGVIWYARNNHDHLNKLRLAPWFPGNFLKTYLREDAETKGFLKLTADVFGNVHPTLESATENLEYILHRIKHSTMKVCTKNLMGATASSLDLTKLAQTSIDCFVLTAMCARASKSYCNGSRDCDIDMAITTSLSHDLADSTKATMEQLDMRRLPTIESRSKIIRELNLKNGGYYAESPLDPNI